MSQNFGSWFPGTKMRSTPSLSMMANRIVPPEDPSRDMASARAENKNYHCLACISKHTNTCIWQFGLPLRTKSTVCSLFHPSL